MANKKYTDSQINEWLELAQEVGNTKATRELGYPNSWGTGQLWAKNRQITLPVDELKQKAADTREWYKEEEIKTVIQEGFQRVHEQLTQQRNLTPDDQKKLSEAANKYYQMWANINNKAGTITENRQTDAMDESLAELLNIERSKNLLRDKEEQPKQESIWDEVS